MKISTKKEYNFSGYNANCIDLEFNNSIFRIGYFSADASADKRKRKLWIKIGLKSPIHYKRKENYIQIIFFNKLAIGYYVYKNKKIGY